MSDILLKGALQSLTYIAVTVGLSFLTPALFVAAATVGIGLLVPGAVLDTSFLTIYFLIGCTLYNGFIMVVISMGKLEQGEDVAHYFSIIIPARNEESVIGETLKHVLKMDYPSELFEVIIVNDGSTDNTESIVRNLQKTHSNLKLMNVTSNNGGLGKGAALNAGFSDFLLTWRGLEIEPRHRWIIGVFDADATPEADMLRKVSFEFRDPCVGGVQTLVRISNRKKSFLAKLQDVEFITFSRAIQFSRAIFKGSVALGGNGQFIRATALDTTAITEAEEYWKINSLTEDLDIGVRLIEKKWENRYVGNTAVYQQGVENLHSLFHQRTRWAWGTLQALRHHVLSLKIWKTGISLKKKTDVSIYVVNIAVPFLVLLCWVLSGLSLLGIIRIQNFFPWAFTLANSFSFFPFYVYGLWKEREEYPLWQMIPLTFMATAYTYHWIPCITSALINMVTQKPSWTKTPRFNETNSILPVTR
jgi:cellulose synthase/poly-beta-1,6-N-acetylglucosamine synthase-like glycosyltransferase